MENQQPESNLHINPQADAGELINLALKMIERHSACGNDSPLKASQIADLNFKAKIARDKHEEGLKYKRLMEAAWRERDALIGLSSNTFGLLQAIINLTQTLRNSYGANRKELLQWGLDENILPH